MRWKEILGFGEKPEPIPDLSGRTFDPFDAEIGVFDRRPILCTVEMTKLRGLQPLAFSFGDGGLHPYVLSLADSLLTGRPSYAGSALEYFYEIWRPQNAAELLGLMGPNASAPLRELSPAIRAWPWAHSDAEALKRQSEAFLADEEFKRQGGKQFNGPKSAEAGSRNYERLTTVLNSIRRKGYRRSDKRMGDIDGFVFSRGRSWALFVDGGQHRSAAVAALGHRTALVRVLNASKPVNRDQVESWPNVRNGLFSAQAAVQLFDRIFEARQPPNFPWSSWAAFNARWALPGRRVREAGEISLGERRVGPSGDERTGIAL